MLDNKNYIPREEDFFYWALALQKLPLYIQEKLTPNDNGCWVWDGWIGTYGYPLTSIEGSLTRACQYIYEACVGPLDKEWVGSRSQKLTLDHYRLNKHDNPRKAPCSKLCCNPLHLEAVSIRENVRRGRKGNIDTRGEKSPNAKLTDQTVREIRTLYAMGDFTQKQLANRYNVSFQLISMVVNHKTWRHLN